MKNPIRVATFPFTCSHRHRISLTTLRSQPTPTATTTSAQTTASTTAAVPSSIRPADHPQRLRPRSAEKPGATAVCLIQAALRFRCSVLVCTSTAARLTAAQTAAAVAATRVRSRVVGSATRD